MSILRLEDGERILVERERRVAPEGERTVVVRASSKPDVLPSKKGPDSSSESESEGDRICIRPTTEWLVRACEERVLVREVLLPRTLLPKVLREKPG